MSTDRITTLARAMLVIAAVAYCGVAWEALAGFPLDPTRAYLSELAAADQPYGSVFRMLDAATGGLVLIACAMALSRVRGPLPTAATAALGLFGLLTIVDAAAPMACASSASASCAAADAAGTLGLSHQIHTVSSAGALAAVIVSAILLSTAVARDRLRVSPTTRRIVLVLVALLLVATVVVSALALLSTDGGRLVAGGGIVQRAQVLLVSAYLVAYAVVGARAGVAR